MASKTLQSTIEIAGILSPSLQAAINNAVNHLDEISQETMDVAGASEKLCMEMNAQESVLKSLQSGYADYVLSGQESSDEAQALADKIQQLSGELDENKGSLQAAEKAAKRLTESQDDSADAYTRLEQKINSQQEELEALRREYANVVLEQGKTSGEAKQLESKIGSLSRELDKNEQKLREVGDAAENAGREAENSSEGYTVLKNVIANLATEAISKAVEAFKELATEGDTALAMLEAKTGATGKTMAGFEDVMYEVYNANYGDSLGSVSDALSTVIQMTDNLDNASLSKVTKNAIALEDVFGYDVTESMRAVNSLMDKFGITSDEAFNLVVQGAQNGLDQNGDLLDTINEYSQQFKDAGYTADDMFNMLANGAETGTWSVDKLGDAVKEFNIRASDGTITDAITENAKAFGMTEEQAKALGKEVESGSVGAYQKLLDKLKEVDDDAQRYQLGVSMFGTMWEDLGEETVLALMDTQGELSKTKNAMDQMDAAAYDTLESSLSQLGRTIKAEVVQPISEKLIPVAKEAVEFVTNQVGPAVDWVLNNLPTIGVVLAGVSAAVVAFKWGSIVSGITKAIGAVKAFGAALMANPIGLVILGITALVAGFVYLWQNCEGFREFWINLWDNIKAAASAAVEWLKNAWSTLSTFLSETWDSISAACSTAWSAIVTFFSETWNSIKTAASSAWSGISSFFSNAWNGIKTTFTNVWDSITSFLSGAWETIKNVVQVGVMFVGSILSAAFQIITLPFRFIWENCKETVLSAWTAIKDTIGNAITAAKEKISTVTDTIKTVASNAWTTVSSAASSKWESIKSTIGSKISAAQQTVSNVTGTIKTVASNAWTTVSSAASSKWESIKSTIGSKIKAAQQTVSNATGTIKTVASNAWTTVSSAASSKWESIKSTISSKLNSAKSTVSSVMRGISSTMKSTLSSAFSTVSNKFSSIYNTIKSKIDSAKSAVSSAISAMKNALNFSWSLPKLKLPHFNISGKFSLDPPSVPKFSIDWYKDGGIMTRPTIFGAAGNKIMAGGEAGAEAVLPLSVLWEKMESILGRILSSHNSTGGTSDEGLTSKAGELLTLDNFSLGSLSDGTNVVIYYDFSNFTWSPQIQNSGTGDDEDDDLMARLRAHEAEFFDWLEEFIQMREVALYGA